MVPGARPSPIAVMLRIPAAATRSAAAARSRASPSSGSRAVTVTRAAAGRSLSRPVKTQARRATAPSKRVTDWFARMVTPSSSSRFWICTCSSVFTVQAVAGLGEVDEVAALTQRPGAFQPRGAGADHQHRVVAAPGRDDLGMPALAPFLAHRRILGAADRRAGHVAADADVAADAFAD